MSQGCSELVFEPMPTLYQRWAEALLPGGIPRESHATCHECAMCTEYTSGNNHGMGFFNPKTKCCTYFPDIPNYLVGRAVANHNAGAALLRSTIEDDGDTRGTATLRAVQPNRKYVTVYTHHHAEVFGRDAELACPFAVDHEAVGGPFCGIWMHRNSVCSTWFCKHVKGLTGARFWQAFQGLLGALEWSLSWWAIGEVLGDAAAVISICEEKDRNIIALRKDAWQHWHGERIDFYTRCAECVEALSVEEAIAIGGINARLHLTELRTRYEALVSTEPPQRLFAQPVQVVRQGKDRTVLQAASFFEPIETPSILVPLLGYFDGRPTEDVIEQIRTETRITVNPNLIRRLYDFGILETFDGGAAG